MPLRFGIFDWLDDAGRPTADLYEDRLRMVERADQGPFWGYHLAEHHGTPLGLAPSPNLFLAAAAQLGVEPRDAMVVGDSVWDLLAAQRAGALGVGLLSGGYGREELESAGAYRVFEDPRDLLQHIDELGIRAPE